MKPSDKTFQVEKAEDSPGFLLWQVTNLWHREIKKALEKHQITHSQFVLLASIHWLTIQQQDVTQIALSNHTKIDPMTTSTVLRTLQTKGFLKRREHSTDTRAKTVALTDSGNNIVVQAIKTVEQFDNDFFRPVDNEEKTFNTQLITLLNWKINT